MRPGDNKWSITIWARNPETGMAKWAFQIEPHDGFGYDEMMENVLVDMPLGPLCSRWKDCRRPRPERRHFVYRFIIALKVRHQLHLDAVPMGPSPEHNDNPILDSQNGASQSRFGIRPVKGGNQSDAIIHDLPRDFPTGSHRR
jgi:hypothetical protein